MPTTQFINCRKCIGGQLISEPLTIDSNGLIIANTPLPENTITIDLQNAILSPGYLELQINGALGFHFAHLTDPETYASGVKKLSHYLPSTGVTGFYPTVPTVHSHVFQSVLTHLQPQDVEGGAAVLGAHVEGPFLAPEKKGAHDEKNMHVPRNSESKDVYAHDVYGDDNLRKAVKILTLAPELGGSLEMINYLTTDYGIKVSMGHSAATYEEGRRGMDAGASLLTHTFNAMNPLHHRNPGLVGLISERNPPYFSIIADEIHLHPRVVAMAYRSAPSHCILITDSIELSGLPDGLHPGHAQIPFRQLKTGNKVTIENTDTLIGTCIGLDECVRNLMSWTGTGIAEAVICVTENVAEAMELEDRGRLEVGRRGDFVVLGNGGEVRETWVGGVRVWERGPERGMVLRV